MIVKYETTDEQRQFCKDPAFYVWSNHELVATIEHGEREIRVYCDGDMRLNLWDSAEACKRGDAPEVIRYCDRLVRTGIDTDKKLSDAFDEGRIEWVNNAWFDLYDGDGEWLNVIHHDIDDAVSEAIDMIQSGWR